MMRTSPKRLALAAALTMFTGCGALPTAPLDTNRAALPAPTARPRASTMPIDDPAPADHAAPPSTPLVVLPDGIGSGLNERAALLAADVGGTLRNGRWRIEVPAGAVTGTARYSVAVSGAKAGVVELGIAPEEMNHFAVPVRLVADCRGVPPKQLATWFISWYDPDTNTWVRVPGSAVDAKKKTVSAPLAHFSTYCVGPEAGRSGW